MDDLWKQTFNMHLDKVRERQDAMEARLDNLENGLKANNEATARIDTNTAGIRDLVQSWDGAMKVLAGVAKVAKPIGIIMGAVLSVVAGWLAVIHGTTPPPHP